MPIEITREAVDVLKRSLAMAGGEGVGIRLRGARGLGGGVDLQVEFATAPSERDEQHDIEGLTLFVDTSITEAIPDALVTVEPQHETIVVRPRPGD